MQRLRGLTHSAQGALTARTVAAHGAVVPARSAVNLSALKLRIRATNNVAKITNVMKLVASSKLRSVEDALANGRAFGESIMSVVSLKTPTGTAAAAAESKDEEKALGLFLDDKKHLVVVVTTDKGLCGSVNSSLTRSLRRELNAAVKAKSDVTLFVLGDKGRAQIARDYAPQVDRAIDSYLDRDPVFPLASQLASKIVGLKYDVLTLWYNHYENQIKFHNVFKQIPQYAGLKPGTAIPGLTGYEIEPDNESETLVNMQEYGVASALFYTLLETVACETSQRVTAMDNASTNAKDMVDRFKLIYNRARQAKITTELTEIISGAESLQSATVSE